MQNTITLSQLITRLARLTGVDNNTARRFLRDFFATVADALARGEEVTVKNFGTFRPSSDPLSGSGPVTFTPDPKMASEINRPFEMFAAVELADGVDFSEIEEPAPEMADEQIMESTEEVDIEMDATTDISGEPMEDVHEEAENLSEEPLPTSAPVSADDDFYVPLAADDDDDDTEYQPDVTQADDHTTTQIDEEAREPSFEETVSDDSNQHRRNVSVWLWVCAAIAGVALLAYGLAVMLNPIPDYTDTMLPSAETEQAPEPVIEEVSVEELAAANPQESPAELPASQEPAAAPAQPTAKEQPAAQPAVKEPVYDTVEVSLIRLAKKHYKVADYWVFIYEANRDKVNNPNTIRPGTRVLIPDASSLPGATKEETRSIARKKQTEILSKF